MTKNNILKIAQKSLNDNGALDFLTIDLKNKTQMADYMLIVSGTSTRHVTALAQKLQEAVKAQSGVISTIEGLPHANWVLVDSGDVITHIFRPEVRDYYQLEEIWQ